MKSDESRTPLPLPAKHQHDPDMPTVIHQPEDDLPLLARWLERAMANRARFWGLLTAAVLGVIGLSVLGTGLSMGRATSDEAWTRLEAAKTPGERVEIAKEYPKTQAERWALLQAATEYYNQGFNDLPANREAALPTLKKALDLFEKVAAESPVDAPQARVAALGVARTLEARNDLDRALRQYEKVARTKQWADTDEARTADSLARALKSPEAVSFYKELYAFKPVEATLPAGGVGSLPFSLPPDHPPVGGTPTNTDPLPGPTPNPAAPGSAGEPSPLIVPPPPPVPARAGSGPSGSPRDLFTPLVPQTATPKAEPPRTKPAESNPGLPADVFSPPSK